MFQVIDVKTGKVLFECVNYEEARNMAFFFDEECRINNKGG